MKKSRFLYAHPDVNPGKILALEALHEEYVRYLGTCVETMLVTRRLSVPLKEKQQFFPPSEILSSQIVKNVRDQAIGIVSGWAASNYETKLKTLIRTKFKNKEFDEQQRQALGMIGKRGVDRPSGKVAQEVLDLYWSWLLDSKIVGKTPTISIRIGMRLSEMTSVLGTSEDTKLTSWWVGFSHLKAGKARIQIPIVSNPYVKSATDVSKGILARKDRRGRWRFEVVERKSWEVPEPSPDAPRVGVDVGLNVMAATSDGRRLGADLKPKFDALYQRTKNVRKNRQRQGFKENSPRLDCLEARLTGLVKTAAGECVNKLVAMYLGYVFVLEDLDLRGCQGQKRFAYRAVHYAIECRVPRIKANPAYTSQECPNCHFVSRRNRSGTKFRCCYCGKISHADVIGGRNLLRRSEDKEIQLHDDPSEVKLILNARHEAWKKHQASLSALGRRNKALKPLSHKLTTDVPSEGIGTASNSIR